MRHANGPRTSPRLRRKRLKSAARFTADGLPHPTMLHSLSSLILWKSVSFHCHHSENHPNFKKKKTAAADLYFSIFPNWFPTAGASSNLTPLPEHTTRFKNSNEVKKSREQLEHGAACVSQKPQLTAGLHADTNFLSFCRVGPHLPPSWSFPLDNEETGGRSSTVRMQLL